MQRGIQTTDEKIGFNTRKVNMSIGLPAKKPAFEKKPANAEGVEAEKTQSDSEFSAVAIAANENDKSAIKLLLLFLP